MKVPRQALVSSALVALIGLGFGSGCSESASPDARPISLAQAGEQVERILALDDPLLRAGELGHLFAALEPEALPEVRLAYDEAVLAGGDTELVLLGEWWARFDPKAALAWTEKSQRAGHMSVVTAVLRSWARRDPRAAWEHSQGIGFQLLRELAEDAVVAGWDESGAPGLVEFVAAQPAGVARQRITQGLARRLVVSRGAQQTLDWVETLEDTPFRQELRGHLAGAAAWEDPKAVAAWATPRITGRARTTGLARRVATRWVRSGDPAEAMAWLESLPPGGDREDGVKEAFRDWSRLDAEAALAWIQEQAVEAWLEPALALYARGHLAYNDAPAGVALAARFEDEDLRRDTTTLVLERWLRLDRPAAEAWLAESDLPPDAVARLLHKSSQPRRRERRATGEAAAPEAPPTSD